TRRGREGSERDVAVFAGWGGVAFGAEQAQGFGDLGAGGGWFDDGVDVAAFGGDVGVGQGVLVLGDEPGAGGLDGGGVVAGGGGDLGELVAVQDVDRAGGAHHRDLGGGPGQVHVGAQVFGAHHVVGPAVGLAGDHGD